MVTQRINKNLKRERKNKAIICLYLFNKMFSFNKIIRLSAFLLLTSEFVIADNLVSQTSDDYQKYNNPSLASLPTFSLLREEGETILQNNYFEFIKMSIIQQPEYSYSVSTVAEKNMLLKYERRTRFPDLSLRVINDKIISRDVDDFTSLRKRQDDSFDLSLEVSQPLYAGGTINNRIKSAGIQYTMSQTARDDAFSTLILDANRIYLQAVRSDFLLKYSSKMLDELSPYLEKVRERVSIGISDPIELAIFSIKYNTLSSRVQKLRTERNRDVGIFEYFFKDKFENFSFPEVYVPHLSLDKNESYGVKTARLEYKNSETETNLVKGEFRPQFGFSARLTNYDIDDEEKKDKDIRGRIYFSMPLFTFGRASAKISSAKAKENATRMSIGIEKKSDDTRENEIVNIVQSSQNTREELISSFSDTKVQRKIINDRLDVVSFSTDSLVNSYTEELSLLETILETEINLLHGYFLYLHQNRLLLGHIGIRP